MHPRAYGVSRVAGWQRDMSEYVVRIQWERTRRRTEAVREKGLFANQNSACPLRNRFTLNKLAEAVGLDEAD